MKKMLWLCTIIFCLVAASPVYAAELPDSERCVSYGGPSPFSLSLIPDVLMGSIAGGLAITGLVLPKTLSLPEPDSVPYNRDTVNDFDRWAMNSYDHTLDALGWVPCGLNLAMPVGIFVAEYFLGNLPAQDALTLGVMFAEAWCMGYGLRQILKISAHRARPYMYFENPKESALEDYDFEFSWPSGHTTDSFFGATFLTYTFCMYYPESKWKIPIAIGSYVCATATGVMRLLSGNHFLTDVLSGAALGSVCGFFVPFIHRQMAKSKNRPQNMALSVQVTAGGLMFSVNF